MRRLTFNPSEAKDPQVVTLEGTSYRIRVAWRNRLRGWYMNVDLVDGTAVAHGVRVTAGGLLVHDMNRWNSALPAGGVLVGTGKEPYAKEDLGQPGGINVHYLTRDEWSAALAQVPSGELDTLVTS